MQTLEASSSVSRCVLKRNVCVIECMSGMSLAALAGPARHSRMGTSTVVSSGRRFRAVKMNEIEGSYERDST